MDDMETQIERLVQLMPPPTSPQCSQGDWAAVEDCIGTGLPADYKSFVNTYGSVVLFNWLRISTPFPFDMEIWSAGLLRFREVVDKYRDLVDGGIPFSIFPDPGGLLPIATTDSTQWVCWITNGNPNTVNVPSNPS